MQGLFKLGTSCLEICPVDHDVKINTNICEKSFKSKVRIANVKNKDVLNINQDIEIKAEIFVLAVIEKLQWVIINTSDEKFIDLFK